MIATVQTLSTQGVEVAEQLHVTAGDLSLTAVHMSYVQPSLLGLPAVVNHRNILTLEHFCTWPTAAVGNEFR